MSADQQGPPTDLEWIQTRNELDKHSHPETGLEKLKRKFSENPFVPIGCLATVGALSYGLYCFRRGKAKMSQNMMRVRIVAQALTVTALLVGVIMSSRKNVKQPKLT